VNCGGKTSKSLLTSKYKEYFPLCLLTQGITVLNYVTRLFEVEEATLRRIKSAAQEEYNDLKI
jgi:hypothetical protein